MGNPVTEDISAVTPEREEADPEIEINEQEHHERVKQLIEDCKKILIPETEVVLGGWALIDADPVLVFYSCYFLLSSQTDIKFIKWKTFKSIEINI